MAQGMESARRPRTGTDYLDIPKADLLKAWKEVDHHSYWRYHADNQGRTELMIVDLLATSSLPGGVQAKRVVAAIKAQYRKDYRARSRGRPLRPRIP